MFFHLLVWKTVVIWIRKIWVTISSSAIINFGGKDVYPIAETACGMDWRPGVTICLDLPWANYLPSMSVILDSAIQIFLRAETPVWYFLQKIGQEITVVWVFYIYLEGQLLNVKKYMTMTKTWKSLETHKSKHFIIDLSWFYHGFIFSDLIIF